MIKAVINEICASRTRGTFVPNKSCDSILSNYEILRNVNSLVVPVREIAAGGPERHQRSVHEQLVSIVCRHVHYKMAGFEERSNVFLNFNTSYRVSSSGGIADQILKLSPGPVIHTAFQG